MSDFQSYRVLVAMETDATRYYGPEATRPALLGATDAEQMLAHIAADLQALIPEVSRCSVVATGALYDQTQILRPGYPVFSALEAAAKQLGAESFKPGLVSIGAIDEHMPVRELQPMVDLPLGLLQLLPIVIHGPSERIDRLATTMEHLFLERGQLSAHSATWLQGAFNVSILHARLMTSTDLNAMLRLQLEHHGFLPIWELLDAALFERVEPLTVTTASDKAWRWEAGAAHTTFETFDYWASEGAGANVAEDRLALAAGYAEWTRELRQYLVTLRAHGVPVRLHLPGSTEPLTDSFLTEVSADAAKDDHCVVTEHQFDDLGTIAVTVVSGVHVENWYPLRPRGLNDMHNLLRTQASAEQTVAFPGTILYDEATRRLRPDQNPVSRAH
jgi:hypothetical protein